MCPGILSPDLLWSPLLQPLALYSRAGQSRDALTSHLSPLASHLQHQQRRAGGGIKLYEDWRTVIISTELLQYSHYSNTISGWGKQTQGCV